MTTSVRGFKEAGGRWIYAAIAVAIGVVVFLGFAESYFLRPFVTHADSLSILVHMHGALMTAWIALFIAQTSLIAIGRRDLHRRLGTLGMALLALILVVSVPMIIVAAKLGGHHMPGPALPALALVLAFLCEFIGFACLGLFYRDRSGFHKRLMLMATITAMEAGVIRLPLAILDHSVLKAHVVTDALLLTIIAIDGIRHRRLHPVFMWGALFLVAMQGFSMWVSNTSMWLRVAQGILEASG
jgi:hypothetical protein